MSSFRNLSSRFFGLIAALALVTTATVADDVEIIEKHKAKIVIAGDAEAEVFEVEDLEVGESRQFFTDDGREVVILRSEDGFDITIDGESIGGDATQVKVMHLSTGDGTESDIEVIRLGDGVGDLEIASDFQIFVGDGEGEGDGKVRVIRLGGEGEGEGGVQMIRLGDGDGEGEGKVKIIRLGGDGDGEGEGKIKIIRRGDGEEAHGEHQMIFVSAGDEDSDHVWVGAGDAQAYGFTIGDSEAALEHLRNSGALDKLDADTRERVLEALEAAERESQNP